LDPRRAGELDRRNRDEQERLRREHADRQRRPLMPLWQARANRDQVSFDDLPVPAFTGSRVVEPGLRELRELIDWQFFFAAWELKGKYPAILEQPAARELFDDGLALLDEIIAGGLLRARAGGSRRARGAAAFRARPAGGRHLRPGGRPPPPQPPPAGAARAPPPGPLPRRLRPPAGGPPGGVRGLRRRRGVAGPPLRGG